MLFRSCILIELRPQSTVTIMARGLQSNSHGLRLCLDPLYAMGLEDSQLFYGYMDVRPNIRAARLRSVVAIEDSSISEPAYEYFDGKLTITGTADRLMCIPVNSLSVIKSTAQIKVIPIYVENLSQLTCSGFSVSAIRVLDDSGSSCKFSTSATGPWTVSLGPVAVPSQFYVQFPAAYTPRKDETILISYRETL